MRAYITLAGLLARGTYTGSRRKDQWLICARANCTHIILEE